MLRRMARGGAAALLLVLVVACGGSEASPSPSASVAAPSAAPSGAALPTEQPSTEPATAVAGGPVRLLAACAGVAVRTGPGTGDEVLVRLAKLAKVRVAETVQGDAYEADACGRGGSDWVKIDRINGTSVKKLYGVPFGYAAAGFFE